MYKEIDKWCVENPCYIDGVPLYSVDKLIVHSPAVIKASGYDTDAIISGEKWFKRWNKASVQKLAHGFIDDGIIYHFLPETKVGWQVGNWYGNCRSIGYELCEYTDKEKALRVYQTAVEYYAYMCNKYGLTVNDILGHKEAHNKWYGSDHSDPNPYFATFGKSMNTFRKDVEEHMNKEVKDMTAEYWKNLTVTKEFKTGEGIRRVAVDKLPVLTAPNANAPVNEAYPTLYKNNIITVVYALSNNFGAIIINGANRIPGFVDCSKLYKV